jgi:putative addiction module component (TIGR02574 family)
MNIAMGAAKPLDKEITHYLGYLSNEQKKVVLSVVKNFTHQEEAWKEDKHFIAEMEKRFKDLETGKDKGITMEELKARVRKSYKNRKKKKA